MDYPKLINHPLFNKLNTYEIEEISTKLIEETYSDNTIIFDKNDTINTIYLILQGNITLYDNDEIVKVLKEDDLLITPFALASDNISKYKALASSNLITLEIHQLAFKEILKMYPKFSINLISYLSDNIQL